MNKGLEALEELKQYWNNRIPLSVPQGLKIVSILEKELKALEIIIEKGVAVGFIQLLEKEHCGGLKEYNDFIGDKKLYLAQEEYDLLKEVLL